MAALLFRDDSYLRTAQARIAGITADGGLRLDRTVFFAAGGGQPGDTGELELNDGSRIAIVDTVYGEGADEIVHVPAPGGPLPAPGEAVIAHIDWARRYRHMRMHTALHVVCAAMAARITGAQIGERESRIDLDMQEPPDREAVRAAIMQAVEADHPVSCEWITEAELDANPDLIKSMSVAPPRGAGLVRLVRIGDDYDLQPCGGTHVGSTLEIGSVTIAKIEKKGRLNRRIRIRLDD